QPDGPRAPGADPRARRGARRGSPAPPTPDQQHRRKPMTLTEMPAKKARKPRTPPKGRTSIVRAADAGESHPPAVAPEPAPEHPAGELKLLAPSLIRESQTNPRKTFSGVEELAA